MKMQVNMSVTGTRQCITLYSMAVVRNFFQPLMDFKSKCSHINANPALVLRPSCVPEKVGVNIKSYSHQKYEVSVIEAASKRASNRKRDIENEVV